MEYYSAFKKKEILPFVITWMNLKDIMLSERSQTKKDKHYHLTYMWDLKENQTHRNREQMGGFPGWEKWVKVVKVCKLPVIR